MAMLAERAECSKVAVSQVETFESTLSPHQVFSIDFPTGLCRDDLAQPDV
jgi:hypothetical protein